MPSPGPAGAGALDGQDVVWSPLWASFLGGSLRRNLQAGRQWGWGGLGPRPVREQRCRPAGRELELRGSHSKGLQIPWRARWPFRVDPSSGKETLHGPVPGCGPLWRVRHALGLGSSLLPRAFP